MKDIDLILYDLDGTIWDSIPVILDSFRHAYVEVFGRCDRTDEDFKSYIGRPLPETFSMHDEETSEKLLNAYLEHNHKLLEQDIIELFPNVMDDLIRIREMGYRQGVVTSKRIYSAGTTLRHKKLDEFFDVCVCKEHTEHHKPEAEPLIYAANQLGITDMSKVVYVGDALPDALCAKNAGARFALVSWSDMDIPMIMNEAPQGSVILERLSDLITN